MSKKDRKAGRRARRMGDRAWEAVDGGNLDIALKEIRRATKERQSNPRLWHDQGRILELLGDLKEAERCFRGAILIAPGYAEAYADLAAVVARQGRSSEGLRLLRTASELAPERADLRERLGVYAALQPEVAADELAPRARVRPEDDGDQDVLSLDRYDWPVLEEALTVQGACLLPGLLSEPDCEHLIRMAGDDAVFEKTENLGGDAGANGTYRFFRRPLPPIVRRLRAEIYPRLVGLANRWSACLGDARRWPLSYDRYLETLAEARQSRSTPILLHYRAPAFNALHRDIWGRFYFPIQLTVTLSRREVDFEGGEFVVADEGAGSRAPIQRFATSAGDGVLFCTRDRLVRVGGRHGLQAVAHGMSPLTRGERHALGVPFHEYL